MASIHVALSVSIDIILRMMFEKLMALTMILICCNMFLFSIEFLLI